MKTKHHLTIDGTQFKMNGEPFDMWGIRVASGTMDQAMTDHLIAQLDDYNRLGTNTVTVFYQGCRGGAYDPFNADGTEIDSGHQERMEQIIKACDDRGMAVIVGIFYFDLDFVLKDADAVRNAVRLVTEKLKGYGNVIINIANEQNSNSYFRHRHLFDFRDPFEILDLIRIVKETDPDRLAGGGGWDPIRNMLIGRESICDVLLFDLYYADTGTWEEEMITVVPWLREHGVTGKPMVNVEIFGGWTLKFPGGVFPDTVKQAYYREIEDTAKLDGAYLFFHNNPWCQTIDARRRFDLAGQGTKDDPGIRWYFEHVARIRGLL